MQASSLSNDTALLPALLNGNGRSPGRVLSPEGVAPLLRVLRENKFPLLALAAKKDASETLADSPDWRDAIEADTLEYNGQREQYVAVRRAWAAAGIPCIMIKSAGTYPAFPYTSDNLDLLVQRDRCAEARAILEELGYVWLRNIDESHKYLFRKFHRGRSVSAIHVHSWVGWDAEFMEDSIWDGAVVSDDDPEVTVPSPADSILVNAGHAFYENKRFSLYDLEKIRACWATPEVDWGYVESVARRRGWLNGLHFALLVCARLERDLYSASTVPPGLVERWRAGLRRSRLAHWYWRRIERRGTTALPFRVSFAFSKALYYQKVLRDQHDRPLRRLSNLLHTFAWGFKQKSGFRPQPGELVSLGGLDGSGKTSHAEALSEALTVSGIAHRVVWSRRGCSPLYRLVSRVAKAVLRPRRSPSVHGDGSGGLVTSEGRGLRASLAQIGWAWFNVFDMLAVYFFRVRLPLLRGKVVICDRYVHDAAVELSHRLPPGNRLARAPLGLLFALSPKPRQTYLLDVEPEAAFQRTPDSPSLAELREQREMYLEFARKHGLSVRDTAAGFAETNDALVREVLRGYESRFDTFLNGLMLSNPRQLVRHEDRTRGRDGGPA
ncbi:MAG: nucleotidyltransferase family protein [Dehalococcoidia bacterium]|nr:nucleotidyltransferase family protein [Dehalococcoidia bacterium]